MNTSPQQGSPCCIFASRSISAREAFLQHGVFGKRLDFEVNKPDSEFFNNIIYLYNIDIYVFTVYYPLVGRGESRKKERSSEESVVGKQLTSKQVKATASWSRASSAQCDSIVGPVIGCRNSARRRRYPSMDTEGTE